MRTEEILVCITQTGHAYAGSVIGREIVFEHTYARKNQAVVTLLI